MEEMKKQVLEILQDMHADIDFENNRELLKVLDSFDIITLISEINDAFDVIISADKIVPENFNSVDALCKVIRELMEEDE